jgi:hypothetical protein
MERSVIRVRPACGLQIEEAAGFYTLVAMMLNWFDVPPPDGARPLS